MPSGPKWRPDLTKNARLGAGQCRGTMAPSRANAATQRRLESPNVQPVPHGAEGRLRDLRSSAPRKALASGGGAPGHQAHCRPFDTALFLRADGEDRRCLIQATWYQEPYWETGRNGRTSCKSGALTAAHRSHLPRQVDESHSFELELALLD